MKHPLPPNNNPLRKTLHLIKRGVELNDASIIQAAYELAISGQWLTKEVADMLWVVKIDATEATEGRIYKMHASEYVEACTQKLNRIAYGDFNEAMFILEQDLREIDPSIARPHKESDIFQPELFTKEQRIIWNTLREVAENHKANPTKDLTKQAESSIKKLRTLQQSFYGPLLPVISAMYIKETADSSYGATITLAYDDPTLIVKAADPIAELVDDYFINQHPIKSPEEFTPKALPKKLGDYTLVSTSTMRLFEYELN